MIRLAQHPYFFCAQCSLPCCTRHQAASVLPFLLLGDTHHRAWHCGGAHTGAAGESTAQHRRGEGVQRRCITAGRLRQALTAEVRGTTCLSPSAGLYLHSLLMGLEGWRCCTVCWCTLAQNVCFEPICLVRVCMGQCCHQDTRVCSC